MIVPEQGAARSLRIGHGALVAGVLILLGFVSLGAWGGWQSYHAGQKDKQIATLQDQIQIARSRYAEHNGELQAQIDADHRQLAVYARDVGNIQARLARLDALGSKLVDKASLDSTEFDFSKPPAYGGPRLVAPNASLDSFSLPIDRLDARLADLDVQLAAVDYLIGQKRAEKAARPHAWPTEHGWLSSGFGLRSDPFTGERERHEGVDIANRFGAPVLAASRGIVTFAGKMDGYGYMVDVDHGYGYTTRYGHMSAIAVHVGDEVADGQMLGRIGSTGRSTGPHLHFEVHRFGQPINPQPYLPRG
jgi:murein DD-endopeptidase MepM/ murein hydrolase activator NlpD